jgi:hypothetical protein
MRYWASPVTLSLALPGMAQATPQGPVILKVTGNLDPADPADGEVLFDMAMIQALPQHEVVTSNPWVDKPHKYGAETGGRADGGEGQRQEHHAHRPEQFPDPDQLG